MFYDVILDLAFALVKNEIWARYGW